MSENPEQLFLPLPQSLTSESISINGRCILRAQKGWRVVSVGGLPMHHYQKEDRVADAYAMISLVLAGYASRVEVARAFGCSSRTVRRHLRRYALYGIEGLRLRSGWKAGAQRVSSKRLAAVSQLKAAGASNREIAKQLKLDESSIREVLNRWIDPQHEAQQPLLPEFPPPPDQSASIHDEQAASKGPRVPSVSPGISDGRPLRTLDTDPTDRWMDRLLARIGLLEDAVPLFRSGERIPHAGVLLAVPALVKSGIFEVATEVYGDLAPAFYGLRTTMLVLPLISLLRLKRPEHLKEHSPPDLGGIFGLDRAPEVKTLRRKLERLANARQSERFGRLLAKRRVATRGRVMGFLYLDGHVRVYHGKHRLPKTHVAQMRLLLPATTDYWVNDRRGDPLFVVTAEANAGLVKMLPILTREIRTLVGPKRRVTIVFDRGGWSPKLFKRLIDDGFDILTYRKKPVSPIARKTFVLHSGRIEKRRVEYNLNDRKVRLMKGKLRLRQVTRLSKDGTHQTPILTSRFDLPVLHVAFRMFERWRQENFFKYMGEEFLIDALVEYAVEPADPDRMVPNPARRKLNDRLREAQAGLAELQQAYGAAALANPETKRPTMRGFKIAHGKEGLAIRAIQKRIATLRVKKRAVPARVRVSQAYSGEVIKLANERKQLTNHIKMVAYQAESDLLALVRPEYARADQEGRTLIQNALTTTAELRVEDGELWVILEPLSSPHRTRAIKALCEELNKTAVCFPGTDLRMHYALRHAE